MSKFKVGDRVIRVRKNCVNPVMKIGDVGTVKKVDQNAIGLAEFPHEIDETPFLDGYFELVAESELERLVRVANEGNAAQRELRLKHPDEFEVQYEGCDWQSGRTRRGIAYCTGFRVKSKPKFEPFTVGNDWTVKLEGEWLHIGCQKFRAGAVRDALISICRNGSKSHYAGTQAGTFSATRSGVWHSEGSISWADADKILEALEKAGVQ